MFDFVKEIINTTKPIPDQIYGPLYRCSLTLKDGTFLPCVVLQSRERIVRLAKLRFEQERNGKRRMIHSDPNEDIVSVFVTHGNRVNDYQVSSASESKYALPLSLLSQIHGETLMGWTGWVFKMTDGKRFSYGTSYGFEFFNLPESYSFADVSEVINHSFVDASGELRSLENGWPDDYDPATIFRERVYFSCAVDGID